MAGENVMKTKSSKRCAINYAGCFCAAIALAVALPYYAADRTISENWKLTSDETADGVLTVPSGVTVDLNHNVLTVRGLAGDGTITLVNSAVSPDGKNEIRPRRARKCPSTWLPAEASSSSSQSNMKK